MRVDDIRTGTGRLVYNATAVAVVTALASLPGAALAAKSALPAAVYAQQVTACTGATPCATTSTTKSGWLTMRRVGHAGATKLFSVVGLHGPLVNIYAAATNGASAAVATKVTYYLQVSGPQAVRVPLIATFTWALKSYTDLGATPGHDQATLTVAMNVNGETTTRGIAAVACPFTAACTGLATRYRAVVLASTPGASARPTKLTLAAASTANPSLDGATAEYGGAMVQAKIAVDPGFPNANLYTVTLSPGLVNR